MTYPTLEAAKAYLRVEDERDDSLIAGLIEAAQDYIERFQGRVYADDDIPAVNMQAAYMLIAHWYENREAASAGGAGMGRLAEAPLGVAALISLSKQVAV